MEKDEETDISGLNDVYKEICELVGFDNMQKFYEQYKGFQISFPTRLYSKDFVREVIRRDFNGTNGHELARKYGYSERWIRALAAEENKAVIETENEGEK